MKGNTKGERTHLLPSKNIGEPAEEELTAQGANRRCDLESKILLLVELLLGAVDITNHDGGDVDGEDVVASYDGRLITYRVRDKMKTYASVKKPTPATMQTLAWNQLSMQG